MSSTDELRRLLDERGVEHTDLGGMTEWANEYRRICRAYTRPEPLTVDVAVLAVPPEQAIAVTLGAGTCKVVSKPRDMWECECGKAWWHGGAPNYCPNCGRRVEVDG